MLKTMSGQMECPKNPGKKFTWWYYEEITRQRDSSEDVMEFPSPQFTYEGRGKDSIPVIRGYCPICGNMHNLDADSALILAKEFNL